ncbi:MAG: UDP-N-acetylmuramate--L-alanine ligase, partial [Christensenellaceae bacterium]
SYTRARTLLKKYGTCFSNADEVLMPDIYPGRDTDSQGMHALDVVSQINKNSANCMYIPSFEEIKDYLGKHWQPGDIVITLGSGDINKQQLIFLED